MRSTTLCPLAPDAESSPNICRIPACCLVFPHVLTLTVTAAFGIKAPGDGVWMSEQAGVVAVTCLALEAGIARGPGVSVICN